MSKKSIALLILLALLPLVTFAWLGWRIARAESLRVEAQFHGLLEERLAAENRKLQQYLERLQRRLSASIEGRGDATASLRALVRETPDIRQAIVLNRRGDLIHPRRDEPMSQAERMFLAEIEQMLIDKDLVRLAFATRPSDAAEIAAGEGWLSWYWGRGVNLMYWRRWGDDRVTIVALARARWMADLLAALPDTQSRPDDQQLDPTAQRICLVDSSDNVVYQWGHLEPDARATPLVESPVVAPLASWRLKYYVDQASYAGTAHFPLAAGLVGMACGLLGLVLVLYREYARDMREATQRVNFVNQVSHELKTPLTNIRLYADLLERDLDQLPDVNLERPRSRLGVIMDESQRLTRMITNVLTFARSERHQLQIRPRDGDLDALVHEVVERSRPALDTLGIQVELETDVPQRIPLDPDAIEQILGNLISNVQRYAAEGQYLGIRTSCAPRAAVVEVSDRGPGISSKLGARVFEPFVRGAAGLSDATGAGIGLSIARRLARLHGGDLTLVPSGRGATFRLTLPRETQHEGTPGGR